MEDKVTDKLAQAQLGDEEVVLGEDGKPLSKKALKKLEQQREKAAKRAATEARLAAEKAAREAAEVDCSPDAYGQLPLSNSSTRPGRTFTAIKDISESNDGEEVVIRARVHNSRLQGNKMCFIVLRQQIHTIQAIVTVKADEISKQMVKWCGSVNVESVVIAKGRVQRSPEPVKSATVKTAELHVQTLHIVSAAPSALPFQIEDATRSEAEIAASEAAWAESGGGAGEGKFVRVGLDTRLNNRVLDLRTLTNQAIFDIQSAICALFREFLSERAFTEIHTPKMIGASSEGGSNLFSIQYFKTPGFLAQSPQLYKQMLIAADRERVFEVGPVFRAEDSNTYRHMTEFTGLDLEMAFNEHYHEVMELIEQLFLYVFSGLEKYCHQQIETVRQQYPCEPFILPPDGKPVRLTFAEAVELLRENGWRRQREPGQTFSDPEQDAMYKDSVPYDDFGTREEKFLGTLVRQKYHTDFYVVDKFPLSVRPFYTMPDATDPALSNSYDFFMRGEEIMSGAQRVHDPALLVDRIRSIGMDPDGLKDYVDAFRLGCPPHAGGGVGLERVMMFYLGLPNIRLASSFPRDPRRLTP